MSLHEDIIEEHYLPGLFFDTDELANIVTFGVSDGSGGLMDIRDPALIETEVTKRYPLASSQGLYMGDILVFVRANMFQVKPKSETIIYLDSQQYKIITTKENHGVMELGLQEIRSH